MFKKKSFIASLTAFLVLISIIFMFPTVSFAQTGTLGTEKPYIFASYYDESGKEADGNALSSGNYRMEIVLSGMASISEMEITAAFGEQVSFGNYSTLAENDSTVSALSIISNGSLILCLVSLNEDCSLVNSDGTVIFSADISVTCDGAVDMENVFSVSANPNFTFAEADYGDIKAGVSKIYDCYSFDTDAEKYSYSGTIHFMECDLSPELGYSVTGKVVAMLSPNAPDSYENAPPLEGVEVRIGDEVFAKTLSDGTFTIPSLKNGTYTAVLHYANGYDRVIEIVVNGADIIHSVPITMVPCDYDNNGDIDISDSLVYYSALGSLNLYNGDINGDGNVDVSDTLIYFSFLGVKSVKNIYSTIVI